MIKFDDRDLAYQVGINDFGGDDTGATWAQCRQWSSMQALYAQTVIGDATMSTSSRGVEQGIMVNEAVRVCLPVFTDRKYCAWVAPFLMSELAPMVKWIDA